MAKVGVIVPAYNSANYLPKAIGSVITQTFTDWQILLVNDGSTDNTEEIVAPYRELLGDKLLYIHQPNRGLPAARNAAIRASDCELLALLDADDIWLPCRLAESVKVFDGRPQVGLAYGLVTMIDENDRPTTTFAGNPPPAEGRIATQIYMRRVELPCPSTTFRRCCVDKVGGFDETMRATEDRDLWLRIAVDYEVAFVPKVIAYYRRSSQSMSADPVRMVNAQLQFIRKNYGKPGCGFLPRQAAYARAYKQKAEALDRRHESWSAVWNALHALAQYPIAIENYRTAGSLMLKLLAGRSNSSGI